MLDWWGCRAADASPRPCREPAAPDPSRQSARLPVHTQAAAARPRPTGTLRVRQAPDRRHLRLLRPAPGAARRPGGGRLHPLHPDPGDDPAGRAGRPRCRRPGPDRHRQDPGLPGRRHQPPADPPGAGRAPRRGPALPDPRPDPRAGDPDPQGRAQVRRRPRPQVRAGVRRRRLRQAARAAAGRRGHHHRHPRAPDRLRQAAQGGQPARLRGVRAGRGRPHVRPRLHQGHPLPAAAHARAHHPPDPAVLGHLEPPRAGAGLRAHERAGEAGGGGGDRDRRARAPEAVLPGGRGEDPAAAGPALAQRGRAHDGVRQHQGVRGAGRARWRRPATGSACCPATSRRRSASRC